eukprot:1420262-Rhodomonas_salina.1
MSGNEGSVVLNSGLFVPAGAQNPWAGLYVELAEVQKHPMLLQYAPTDRAQHARYAMCVLRWGMGVAGGRESEQLSRSHPPIALRVRYGESGTEIAYAEGCTRIVYAECGTETGFGESGGSARRKTRRRSPRPHSSRLRAQGSLFGVEGSLLRAQGSRFTVWGMGSRCVRVAVPPSPSLDNAAVYGGNAALYGDSAAIYGVCAVG